MKAYYVIPQKYPENASYVAAVSRGQAKYRVVKTAQEFGWDLAYTDAFSIRRATIADQWANSEEADRYPVVDKTMVDRWNDENLRE